MKKTLIALAVISAAGVASAQSSVTLYGNVDAYLVNRGEKLTTTEGPITRTTSARQTKLESGGFGASNFGMTGSEDLGGGLKANFQLEGEVKIDTGASVEAGKVFNAQSWVGLSGGFGTLRIGKMSTAMDQVAGMSKGAFGETFSPSNGGMLSSYNFIGGASNSIYYGTPSLSGFSAAVSLSAGEGVTTPTVLGRIVSVNAQYAGGPVTVAVGHQQEKATNPAGKYTQLHGSYDLGVAKLRAGVGQAKNGAVGAGGKGQDLHMGVDVPLGNALSVSVGIARGKITEADGDVTKNTGFGVAAKYSLSKRTFFYTGFNAEKSKDADSQLKTNKFGVGVRHSF